MKKIIAISGTHGCGKTYLAYNLCIYLKKLGKNVLVLDELARESPFKINTVAEDESQIWLACKQVTRELELMDRYEYIITDRSVLDAYCYGKYLEDNNNEQDWIYSKLIDYLVSHVDKYYKYLYVLDPIAFNYNVEDGVRDTDSTFRDKVHENLLNTLDTANVDYKLIRSEVSIYSDFV